jgi:hypothetical protein
MDSSLIDGPDLSDATEGRIVAQSTRVAA